MTEFVIKYKSVYFQIPVKDLERAKKFYEEIFGLQVSWYQGIEAGWCELNLPVNDARIGLNSGELEGGVLTLEVENLEETRSYLKNKKVDVTKIIDIPNMVSYFNCKDSEGNRIQIVSDPQITE